MLTLNYSLEVLLKQWYEPFRNETLDMQHILLVHIKIYIPALLPPKKKRIFFSISYQNHPCILWAITCEESY
jgi:hypothetical protein